MIRRLAMIAIPTLSGLLCFGLAEARQQPPSMNGTWEITGMIDDGKVYTQDQVKNLFIQNAKLTVNGQTISIPDAFGNNRALAFVTNTNVNPPTIDLAGQSRTNGKGIYLLGSDSLVLCFGDPDKNSRPTQFGSTPGSSTMMITMKKVGGYQPPPPPPAAPVSPPAVWAPTTPPPVPSDATLALKLIGTWGHQNDDAKYVFTLNSDGSFSSTKTYTGGFKKIFDDPIRSSGDWKLKDGVVILNVTSSTDRDMRYQVYSYRIRSFTGNEIISVDQNGRMRRDWRMQ